MDANIGEFDATLEEASVRALNLLQQAMEQRPRPVTDLQVAAAAAVVQAAAILSAGYKTLQARAPDAPHGG